MVVAAPPSWVADRVRSHVPAVDLRDYQEEAVTRIAHAIGRDGRRRVVVVMATGGGKAQPVDEVVLTPSGWRPIGSIAVGDAVIGSDGTPTRVTGVYPQGERDVWRVRFSDGAEVRCDPEHLWAVATKSHRSRNLRQSRGRPFRVLTTREILAEGLRNGGGWRHYVPLVAAPDLPAEDLPLDPYLLGVLLGDGGLSIKGQVRVHTEDDLAASLPLPEGLHISRLSDAGGGAGNYLIGGKTGKSPNAVLDGIRQLGLNGQRSWEKFIPEPYLRGRATDRLALLQGILDADGNVSGARATHADYVTVAPSLVAGVCELVRSLGGTCRVRDNVTQYTYLGEKKVGRPAYRISIMLPAGMCPFRYERKAQSMRDRTKYHPTRKIVAIEPSGRAECVCIAVEGTDRLYVTRDYVLTHNTVVFGALVNAWLRDDMGRVLILAHRDELISQAVSKVGVWIPRHLIGVVKAAQNETDRPVVVASVQTVRSPKRLEQLGAFSLVVIDECFPSGTLIDGRPISEIRVGDYVRSVNHETGVVERRRVTRTFRRQPSGLVVVRMADGRALTCTPEHPVYAFNVRTRVAGYLPASQLSSCHMVYNTMRNLESTEVGRGHQAEGVCGVRDGLSAEKLELADDTDLLAGVQGKEGRSTTEGVGNAVRELRHGCHGVWPDSARIGGQERPGLLLRCVQGDLHPSSVIGAHGRNESEACFLADEGQQSDEESGVARPHEHHATSDGMATAGAPGERVAIGAANAPGVGPRVGDGSLDPNQPAARFGLPDSLQGGYRQRDAEGGGRSGRGQPRDTRETSGGSEEGCFIGVLGVDRVAVQERGRDPRFDRLCPDGLVYNLEVEGNHNYFAEDILVHNCHHAAARSYRDILDGLGAFNDGGPIVVGVTATPRRADGAGIDDVFEDIVYQQTYTNLVAKGWLVPPRGLAFDVIPHEKKRVGIDGDYDEGWLGRLMLRANAPGKILEAWQQHGEGRPTIVFTPTVSVAQAVAATFNDARIPAAWVSGAMPIKERRAALDLLRTGDVKVVANCAVLCLDAETEILTEDGWVGIDGMTYSHRVANWRDDGTIFFEEPKFIVRRDRMPDERMVAYESPRRSVRVTQDHRMLQRKRGQVAFTIRHAAELAGEAIEIPVSGVAEPQGIRADQPVTAGVDARRISANAYALRRAGMEWDASFIEAERRARERDALHHKDPSDLTLDECRFIGFWIGDGTRTELQSGGVEYSCTQSMVYPEIISWFDRVIAQCRFDVAKRAYPDRASGVVRWSFGRGTGFGPQQRAGIFPIEPYLQKDGTSLFRGLNVEQFAALLEGLWKADGLHNSRRPAYGISNTNLRLLELLQTIAVCRGFDASIRKGSNPRKNPVHAQDYWLNVVPKTAHRLAGGRHSFQVEAGWKPERVWCVTSTTGNIVTRRNGSVTIMGNTEGFDEPSVSCIMMARPTMNESLYVQMVGRGTRCLGLNIRESVTRGKKDVLILDMVGCSDQLTLDAVVELVGKPKGARTGASGEVSSTATGEPVPYEIEDGELVARTVKLHRSICRWVELPGKWFALSLLADGWITLSPDDEGAWMVTHRPRRGKPTVEYTGLPLDLSKQVGEGLAKAKSSCAGLPMFQRARWLDRSISEKQLAYGRAIGLPVTTETTAWEKTVLEAEREYRLRWAHGR